MILFFFFTENLRNGVNRRSGRPLLNPVSGREKIATHPRPICGEKGGIKHQKYCT